MNLQIDPRGSLPTALKIIAPPNFNFTQNCLVEGGPDIQNCMRKRALSNGRDTAMLQTKSDGLDRPVAILIKVISPNMTPSTTAWFVWVWCYHYRDFCSF